MKGGGTWKGGSGDVQYMGISFFSAAAPVFLARPAPTTPPLPFPPRSLPGPTTWPVYVSYVQLNFPCELHGPLRSEGPLAPLIHQTVIVYLLYIYSTTKMTLEV